jgi:hypothetical protein
MATRLRFLFALSASLLLSGCISFRNYNAELDETLYYFRDGYLDNAVAVLDRNNPIAPGDLLYNFERGELLRLSGNFAGSYANWDYADRLIEGWANSPYFDSFKGFTDFNSYSGNDKVRLYDGHDFEKVALTTQMALMLLSAADTENARVAIKKTHEREAIIADKRDKEYLALENQAKDQGIPLKYKDLQGYPVATLDAPEVVALKNSYQSAFSHYLAGFIYESLDEKDLAAPGYRQAIELRPNTPLLEQALRNLAKSPLKAGEADVLLIVQTGLAPALVSVRVPISVTAEDQTFITNMSFPAVVPDTSTPAVDFVTVDDKKQKLTLLNSFGDMSRRTLRDDMPGIIQRTLHRAQNNAQYLAFLKKRSPEKLEEEIQQQALREDADTRVWRTLPDKTLVARLRLKKGLHQLTLPNAPQYPPIKFEITQTHQAFSVRAVGNRLYAADVAMRQDPKPAPLAVVASPAQP